MSDLQSMPRPALAIMLAAALLAGCASGNPPEAQTPALELPGALNVPGVAGATDWRNWAALWQDAALQGLLQEADANSQDLQLASARIAEARASAQIAQANRAPAVDLYSNNSRSRSSLNTGRVSPGANPLANDFNLGISASYEVDFWGKLADADQAARARLLSAEAGRATVRMSLYANIVQTYLNLRATDAQLVLTQSLLASREQVLQAQQQRAKAGLTAQQDVNLAAQEVQATRQSLSQLGQAQRQAESALALLAGRSPAQIAAPQIARGATLEELLARTRLPQDTPSELLRRRPDVRSAEANLSAAQADLAQARTAYFPSLRLTASYGRESRELKDLFNPASMLWNLAANLTQPLFRAGSISAAVEGGEARRQQALAQYVQSVQGAFRDVHDALGALEAGNNGLQAQQERARSAAENRRLLELRNQRGLVSRQELANGERDLLSVKLNLLEAQRQQLQAVLGVYRALGKKRPAA